MAVLADGLLNADEETKVEEAKDDNIESAGPSTRYVPRDIEQVIREVQKLAADELMQQRRESIDEYMSRGTSLFILQPTNPFRLKVHELVTCGVFDYGVQILILFSAIFMATESNEYGDTGDTAHSWRATVEKVILAVFAAEMLLRVIDRGLLRNQGALLRSAWGTLDFGTVFIGILDAIIGAANQVRLCHAVPDNPAGEMAYRIAGYQPGGAASAHKI